MKRYTINEVSFTQKHFVVEANSKDEAHNLHKAGKSRFVREGGCLDGEVVNTDIEELER